MNTELQALFEQDQADRSIFFEHLDHEQRLQVLQRDRARRKRVEEIVGSEALQAPEDYFNAAMVFQRRTSPQAGSCTGAVKDIARPQPMGKRSSLGKTFLNHSATPGETRRCLSSKPSNWASNQQS